ncbi:hypothetical protein [Actinomadura atramentaria]|uniref:DUF7927 domain-containing protein n=1 Tax=Actinomadura atramentaria TaxID=1990 RepID=UPI0003AA5D1D|nr:hypothetical protein [Actinomadura atramentaria]
MRHFAITGLSGGLVSLAVAAAAVGTGTFASGRSAAAPAEVPSSDSVAVRLTVANVPQIGLTGFSGTGGSAHTGSSGGFDQSSFGDAAALNRYLTFFGPRQSQTSGINAPLAYDARTNLVAVESGPLTGAAFNAQDLFTVANLHSYARCAPPAQSQASVAITAAALLGTPLRPGVPLTLEVTGAQLGAPRVASGTITATLTVVEDHADPSYAEARAEFDLRGDLTTVDGEHYSGPLAHLVLGDERAYCTVDTTGMSAPPVAETPNPSETPLIAPNDEPTAEPPTEEPPAAEPPAEEPPAEEPPAAEPPGEEPGEPLADEPPIMEPPIIEPPIVGPPFDEPEPPGNEPPTAEPPTSEPPTTVPPTTVPPTTVPPTTGPPTTVPPTTGPPTDLVPPITAPPTTGPPSTVPPTTVPPTIVPPTTVPPTGVLPPTTEPPGNEPPTSGPPTTGPPTGVPPTTAPPNGEPPTGEPPAGVAPPHRRPHLSAAKRATRWVRAGGRIHYTITVRNTGDAPFTTGRPASFADDLRPMLGRVRYAGDAHASRGTVVYRHGRLVWRGALRPGQSATIHFTVVVKKGVRPGTTLRNTLEGGRPLCGLLCTTWTGVLPRGHVK